jgi:tetratricopeptide (TPR) repeat protein
MNQPKGKPDPCKVTLRYNYDYEKFAEQVRAELKTILKLKEMNDKAVKTLAASSGVNFGTLYRVVRGKGVKPDTRRQVIDGVDRLARERGEFIDVGFLEQIAGLVGPENVVASMSAESEPLDSVAEMLRQRNMTCKPDPLATSLDRRAFLGSLGAAVTIVVPEFNLVERADSVGQRVDPGGRWQEIGREHSRRLEYDRAAKAFSRATDLAATDEARALAKASRAQAELELYQYDLAHLLLRESLVDLDLADLPPDSGMSPQMLETRVSGRIRANTALEAFGIVAKTLGTLVHVESEFARAERSYVTYAGVAEVLGNDRMLAEAIHYQAKSTMEQGSIVVCTDPAWRLMRKGVGPRLIDRAVALAEQAYQVCPKDEGLSRAVYQRVIARALWLQGDVDAAFDAEEEAHEGYGGDPSALSLYIDRGRIELLEKDPQAKATLLQALEIAFDIDSGASVATILASLAHEDVLGGSPDEAKTLIAASLLAWSIPVETRDSIKSIGMFHRLKMSLDDVRAFLTESGDLLDALWDLRGFDGATRLANIERRLDLFARQVHRRQA